MKKIVLTGGGTAGHIYPLLALLPYLKEYEIHYIGSSGMEKGIVNKYSQIKFHEIPTVKLIRKLTFKNLAIPFKLIKSILKAKKIIKEINPNIIFSKGGFVALPVVYAGKWCKIPVVSHESDLSMGLANKLILKKCDAMCTTFYETSKISKKCIYTGQPIRQEILSGNPALIKNKFKNENPILLVIGGSLGSAYINEQIWRNIDKLLEQYNVIHIVGRENKNLIERKNYLQLEFCSNIGDYFSASDMVISRAGSGVINELLQLHKPMLLIPLSKKCSRGDQIENAKLFEKLGYCEMLEEENFTYEKLISKLNKLQKDNKKFISTMKQNSTENANKKIIEVINKFEKK